MSGGRRTRLRTRSYIAACLSLVAALVAATPAHADSCEFEHAQPGTADAQTIAAATLCVVNRERARAGLKPLKADRTLAAAATGYATEMVDSRDFEHRSARSGSVADRVHDAGGSLARWLELGENLGWGTYSAGTPAAIVSGWMASPTHRDNILFPRFRRLGVGTTSGAPVAGGRTSALTYVAVFGQPRVVRRCVRKRAAARATQSARGCRAAGRAGTAARR